MKRREFLKMSSAGLATSTLLYRTIKPVLAETGHVPEDARYVWYDNNGLGRDLYACFRKSVVINGSVNKAELCLFADTTYRLFINGVFIEFGPVRFDPRFPMYDKHDISRHLQPGKNVIAVEVNYFGHKTYKSFKANAGFITWGEIKTDSGQSVSLVSNGKTWKCRKSDEHERYASKTSFALNTAEIFDQKYESFGWKAIDFDDSNWKQAVILQKQDFWGEPAPRSIPYMSGEKVPVGRIMGVYPLRQTEDWTSFTIPLPFYFEENANEYSRFLAFKTWIYSPVAQDISPGVFWGESWLNGEELARGTESVNKSMRIQQKWKLKKGWNYFFGKVGAYFDAHQHYLALPKGKGLIVAADKNKDSEILFYRLPILKAQQYDTYLKNKKLPYAPDDPLSETGGWLKVTKADAATSPCRETSWDDYAEPFEKLTPQTLDGFVFKKSEYPEGFAILIDMGYIHLMFPEIKMLGVKGAVIDVTGEEHLNPDNKHITHNHHYKIGDRIYCTKDSVDWFPFHPKGVRYLKITVRNTTADVKFASLTLRSANYPVEEKGRFVCSDPLLNEIWEMGRRTQRTNMEDAYVDCVGRERGMYGRDTIIQYHVNLAVFGDHALMRRCMELFGQSPDATGKFRATYPNTGDYTIADFALNMVEGFKNYYENTGDKLLINKYWNAILINLAWFNELADERADLLLDAEWDKKRGVRANYGGFHGDLEVVKGHIDNTGIHCIFSCTYLIALQSAVFLANALGHFKDAGDLQRRVDILSRTIPQKFWDPQKKCFADNLKRTTHSIHANLFPVRAGLVDQNRLKDVQNYVADQLQCLFVNGYDPSDGVYTSPNFAFYIFDGLYKAGLIKTAENMMKQGWGWALAQGLKTCPEYFSLSRSQCHAWSASPTYYLSKYVLGVHFPQAPDMDYVELNVKTHYVNHAEGSFPHPKGDIEIKWHRQNGKIIYDYVNAPDGVKVKIVS